MKKCKKCGHEGQWHTKYGCLYHAYGTELLSEICPCDFDNI